jgi:hypothetical protein
VLKLVTFRDRKKLDDLADVLFILENYTRYELFGARQELPTRALQK